MLPCAWDDKVEIKLGQFSLLENYCIGNLEMGTNFEVLSICGQAQECRSQIKRFGHVIYLKVNQSRTIVLGINIRDSESMTRWKYPAKTTTLPLVEGKLMNSAG
ncbi:hypothetical protein NPIL_515501 [Nephila pilipes]|uniref:Uncharacterized protein n=1 Tax=Nephila pilipes TaxID=299642 RepID=A0A8X6R037_NEPPI|nr:hypothetical protein NPIL_515501 [Nephila pilipes]